MARNAIKSDIRSSKMAAVGHFVKNFKNKKSCVLIWNGEKCDQKWFSVIQNGRRRPFCKLFKKKELRIIWNGEKCDRKWLSVIQNGRRWSFCKKKKKKEKLCIDLKWRQKCDRKWLSVIQNGGRRPFCEQNSKKLKVAYWSKMARNAIKSDFRSSKMAAGSHFVNLKKKSCVLIWNGEKWDRNWFLVIQNSCQQPFCEKKIKEIKSCVLI